MKILPAKTLILLRHAHRDKSQGRELDNGLSAKGQKQTEKIAEYYRQNFGGIHPVLYSSPKKRCIQTIAPIGALTGAKVQILPELDESENPQEVLKRVRRFDRRWRDSDAPLTVISSHGDWIPAFLGEIVGTSTELAKGGWAQVELKDNAPQLTWLMQEL